MMPNSRTLTEKIRMYSVDPVPIARSLRESIRLSDHIQAITSSPENNQYETTLNRESSRIDTWALPSPNQAICVPKATTTSADEVAQPEAPGVARSASRRGACRVRCDPRRVARTTAVARGARGAHAGSNSYPAGGFLAAPDDIGRHRSPFATGHRRRPTAVIG